jgi:hypothetical protein
MMYRRGGTMGDDNWQADLAGLSRLQVDVEHLGNIKAYLDQVANAIKQDLRPYVFEVNRLATTGGDESRSALGGTEIREVGDLAKRIEGTFQAVDNTLKSMAEALLRSACHAELGRDSRPGNGQEQLLQRPRSGARLGAGLPAPR